VTGLRTEFDFVLPTGYLDADGELHREGRMRLATAADEILPLKDPRVQANPAYLVVILLSRVIVALGSVDLVNPKVIEGLFASDLTYLQDFYNRINSAGTAAVKVSCPHCEQWFEMEPPPEGESMATPSISSTRR
jgi:hypothetical protein